MSNSLLYARSVTAQTMAVGDTVTFGNVIRRYGQNCYISDGNVTIDGIGYYKIDTDFTFTAGGAGTAVITLYKDGTQIAQTSFTTVASTIYSVALPAVARQKCCCEGVITAVVTGVAGTMNSASIVVEKA